MQRSIGSLLFVLLGTLYLAPVEAADRALIVGVGEYKNPKISDLSMSGVPEDVEMYVDIAQMMGIDRKNIRVLRDDQATAKNIVLAIQDWLQQGVAPGDLAMFAYSGHGSWVRDEQGDEPDGRDEGLVAHDAYTRDGVSHNFVMDDTLSTLFAGVPTEDFYVFIDACHSGSVTRSLSGNNALGVKEVRPKFHQWSQPDRGAVIDGVSLPVSRSMEQVDSAYLAFSAAQDDQYSYGSSQGGIFTLSIWRQFQWMAENQQSVTAVQMMSQAKADIESWAGDSDRLFEPNVAGPANKLGASMPMAGMRVDGYGAIWQRLSELVAERDAPLDLRINQATFQVGERLQISVLIPEPGYLNIVNVDARDNATILFPNAQHPDNRVSAGAVTIPTQDMLFDLVAGDPLGNTLVVAFLTREPVNLYELGIGERSDGGLPFRALSMQGIRAFQVIPVVRDKGLLAAELEARVIR